MDFLLQTGVYSAENWFDAINGFAMPLYQHSHPYDDDWPLDEEIFPTNSDVTIWNIQNKPVIDFTEELL